MQLGRIGEINCMICKNNFKLSYMLILITVFTCYESYFSLVIEHNPQLLIEKNKLFSLLQIKLLRE